MPGYLDIGTISGIKSFDTTCPRGKRSQCHGLGNFWGVKERSDLYKLACDFVYKKMDYPANSYLQLLDDNTTCLEFNSRA